jgi:hypothetical protein
MRSISVEVMNNCWIIMVNRLLTHVLPRITTDDTCHRVSLLAGSLRISGSWGIAASRVEMQ